LGKRNCFSCFKKGVECAQRSSVATNQPMSACEKSALKHMQSYAHHRAPPSKKTGNIGNILPVSGKMLPVCSCRLVRGNVMPA
jgi:hypothetical protein